ncbi:placenta-specific protein 8 -like [Brachionus plicatilis]|uniref:Placenta-specific protein 8-like n=1 Tax=Brachionus plicatilis TaxID=10195 RepID=A0A3M7REW7_BRAPC|nr:placenta-specific protein 8 -like [Brachionus plicatilis]
MNTDKANVEPIFTTITQPGKAAPIMKGEQQNYVYSTRAWSVGLFDCFDNFREFLLAMFCAPCYMFYLFDRADERFSNLIFGNLTPLRTKIRVERSIDGNLFEDALVAHCCPACTMLQISEEMRLTDPLV